MQNNLYNTDPPIRIDLNNLNILRCFAIMLVVLRHSFAPFYTAWEINTYYETNAFIQTIGKYVATFSLPLFVFISGFIYAYLRIYKNKYNTYKILINKKVRRLLIPYFFFGIIYITFFMRYDHFIDFIKPFWYGAGHLWFLLMIFLVFLIFYPLELFFKKNVKLGVLIAICCFIISPIFNYIGLDPIRDITYYFIFFYTGYIFCSEYAVINKFVQKNTFSFFVIHGILFLFSVLILKDINNRILALLINQLITLILAMLAISFSFGFFPTLKASKKTNHFISNINKNSYYIYIIHQPLMMILFSWSFMHSLPPYLIIIIGFSVGFFISLLISEIFFNNRVSKVLIGS